MKLERTISYLLPEGEFTGTILGTDIHEDFRNDETRENLRFTIAVDPLPDDPVYDYRARVDYWSNQPNSLLPDLHALVGPDVVDLTDVDGTLLPRRLSVLNGKRVRFTVIHSAKNGHKTPFRKVVNLRPLGRGLAPSQTQVKEAA